MSRFPRFIFLYAVAFVTFAFGVSPALAGTGYRFDLRFGSEGSGEGQFNGAAGIAVNQTSEDVYVADYFNERVERFDAKGKYLSQFNGRNEAPEQLSRPAGIAVDNSCYFQHKTPSECASSDPSNGDVYVSDLGNNVIDKFSPEGAYIGRLTGEHVSGLEGGLAVDSNGVVWVYRTTGKIDSFSNALVNVFLPPEVTSPYPPETGGFAVDSHDDLYVKTQSLHVAKLNSSGVSLIEQVGGEVGFFAFASVAVDLASDNVFIANGETVGVFNEAASSIATIRLGAEHSALGIGINAASGTLYVSEYGNVDILSSGPTPPPPKTDAVTNLTATSATFNGDLNPEGVAGGAGFYFSYNIGASCTGLEPRKTVPGNATGSVDVAESAPVTKLQPNKSYAVCFFASSEFGATAGSTVTFTTPPAKPSIDQQSASGVTLTAAELNAKVNPNNQQLTSCKFEYGATNTYGHELPCEPPSLEGYGEKPVSANILGGLISAETYHYRVVAANATGTTEGPDQTFTTVPFPPTVTLGEATAGTDTATVNFAANAQGGDTQYAVRYGTTATYTAQALGDAGHSRSGVPIAALLSELAPGTTYHYSVRVQNAGGGEATTDQTFTTRKGPSPPAKEATTTEEPAAIVPLALAQPVTPPVMFAPMVFPTETGTVTPSTSKPSTRAQKLSKALKACKKQARRKRAACERHAHKQYATSKKASR
jgi:sugar lactone lactonase YvrE